MLNEEIMWRAFESRDDEYIGRFIVGVQSTGIYCRPGCPAKTPQRKNVVFFTSNEEAEKAGFRACFRCKPNDLSPEEEMRNTIQIACRKIEENLESPLTLKELSEYVGLSQYHFQRSFKRIIGISPKQYSLALKNAHFKQKLKEDGSVTQAVYEAGFGSSSRVYEHSSSMLGMTPASYGKGGLGAEIAYSIVKSPLGKLLVARTRKGLCSVMIDDDEDELKDQLHQQFPSAEIREDTADCQYVQKIVNMIQTGGDVSGIPLDIRATAFQWRVWNLIKSIPAGSSKSYSELAHEIGQPEAVRAVARSCATNPVALVIPCHRVVGKNGSMTGYRWGVERKEQLLKTEHENI